MNLYPYQNEGVEFLASKRTALLADEMGLGKTAQAICAADELLAERILVVCPAVARPNWLREFQKWSLYKRPFNIIETMKDEIDTKVSTITSYDLAVRRISELNQGQWDVLILDEVHYLKSPNAKRTLVILGSKGLVRCARYIWALSGTPMPNHAGELWLLCYTFGATRLDYYQFTTEYCLFTTDGKILGTKNHDKLKALLSKMMLRRTGKQVNLQLPPIRISNVVVVGTKVQLEEHVSFFSYLYPVKEHDKLWRELDRQEARLKLMLEDETEEIKKLEMLAALAQSVSSLRRFIGLQKVPMIAEMISQELVHYQYKKIVIFAHHQDVIESLRKRLEKYGCVTLYGAIGPKARQRNIDKFDRDPKCRIFIANIQAAGTAINLTVSHQVLFAELSWIPGDNAQALKRCHRIGQKHMVDVRIVSLIDSIDDAVNQVLGRKTEDIIKVFE